MERGLQQVSHMCCLQIVGGMRQIPPASLLPRNWYNSHEGFAETNLP
jgi:hypothetical protein